MAQCTELCLQLRGQADKRQVPDAKLALQHNLGLGGAVVVALYKMGFSNDDKWVQVLAPVIYSYISYIFVLLYQCTYNVFVHTYIQTINSHFYHKYISPKGNWIKSIKKVSNHVPLVIPNSYFLVW